MQELFNLQMPLLYFIKNINLVVNNGCDQLCCIELATIIANDS